MPGSNPYQKVYGRATSPPKKHSKHKTLRTSTIENNNSNFGNETYGNMLGVRMKKGGRSRTRRRRRH